MLDIEGVCELLATLAWFCRRSEKQSNPSLTLSTLSYLSAAF